VLYLNSFESALHSRFEQMGSTDNLNKAIETIEQAVLLTPDDHVHRPMYLYNWGNGLRSWFNQTGSIDDLNQAMNMNELAISFMADSSPYYGKMLIPDLISAINVYRLIKFGELKCVSATGAHAKGKLCK
jgi:hypothetical protein